jgi:GAF domain-containing protein
MPLTHDDIETLAADAATSPNTLFEAIADVATRSVNAGLVTVMRHDAAASTVERLYSSNPQAYPVGAKKAKRDTAWGREVLTEHRLLVSAGDAALAKSFDDHATIIGLGLHSCVNVPLVSESKCVGTLNVCAVRSDWTDDEVSFVRALGLAALAGVLAVIKS